MTPQPGVTFDVPLLRTLWECQEHFKCKKFSLEDQDTLFVCSVEAFFAGLAGYQPTFWRSVGVIESVVNANPRRGQAIVGDDRSERLHA